MNYGKENERLEFKNTTSEIKEAMDNICAILNKHGLGTLYLGINPNGGVYGQEIRYLTLDDIVRTSKEAIIPMIYPLIRKLMLKVANALKLNFQEAKGCIHPMGFFIKELLIDHQE